MKKVFFNIALVGLLLSLPSLSAAQNFEEQRKEIIQKQKDTRSEIEELNAQISSYEQRLQKTNKRFTYLYEQYENQKRLIAHRDEKISKLESEQTHKAGKDAGI